MQLPPADGMTQQNINTLLSFVAALSIAVNGWFLRGVAKRLDELGRETVEHGNRLTWLEARQGRNWGRRAYDELDEAERERRHPSITPEGE